MFVKATLSLMFFSHQTTAGSEYELPVNNAAWMLRFFCNACFTVWWYSL